MRNGALVASRSLAALALVFGAFSGACGGSGDGSAGGADPNGGTSCGTGAPCATNNTVAPPPPPPLAPAFGKWSVLSVANSPFPREQFSVVWTGQKAILWGGTNQTFDTLADGGIYDLASDSWARIPADSAISARYKPHAFWAGDKMVVFGGYASGVNEQLVELMTGGVYDLATGTWKAIDCTGVLSPRLDFAIGASATSLLVFGGVSMLVPGGGPLQVDGAIVDLSTQQCRKINGSGAGLGNLGAVSVQSYKDAFVLSEGNASPKPDATNATFGYATSLYTPATDSWQSLATLETTDAIERSFVVAGGDLYAVRATFGTVGPSLAPASVLTSSAGWKASDAPKGLAPFQIDGGFFWTGRYVFSISNSAALELATNKPFRAVLDVLPTPSVPEGWPSATEPLWDSNESVLIDGGLLVFGGLLRASLPSSCGGNAPCAIRQITAPGYGARFSFEQ